MATMITFVETFVNVQIPTTLNVLIQLSPSRTKSSSSEEIGFHQFPIEMEIIPSEQNRHFNVHLIGYLLLPAV